MRTKRLAAGARADIQDALKTSRRMFGTRARRDYALLIDRAITMLRGDPQRGGVQHREDLPGLHLFHLRHARTRGAAPKQARHIIVFTYDDTSITVLRVLHDSMDVTQRTNSDDET